MRVLQTHKPNERTEGSISKIESVAAKPRGFIQRGFISMRGRHALYAPEYSALLRYIEMAMGFVEAITHFRVIIEETLLF